MKGLRRPCNQANPSASFFQQRVSQCISVPHWDSLTMSNFSVITEAGPRWSPRALVCFRGEVFSTEAGTLPCQGDALVPCAVPRKRGFVSTGEPRPPCATIYCDARPPCGLDPNCGISPPGCATVLPTGVGPGAPRGPQPPPHPAPSQQLPHSSSPRRFHGSSEDERAGETALSSGIPGRRGPSRVCSPASQCAWHVAAVSQKPRK